MIRTDPSGRVVGAITPPEISRKIYQGLQPAEYDRIKAPALGIFNKITPQYCLPYYWYLDPARQEEFNRNIDALAKWIEGAIQRFRSGVKNSRVIELHNTCHYVFIVDEALSFEKRASSCSMNEAPMLGLTGPSLLPCSGWI